MDRSIQFDQREDALADAQRDWKGLYAVSGILLIITAAIWTVVSRTANALYASGYPGDPAAYLQLVSQHQFLASVTWILWIIADFLLMAPTVALYLILRPYNRTLALLGSLFAMSFNIYDICVTELNSLVLVSLSHQYAIAATDALRAPLIAAASYGYYALPIQTVLSFAMGPFGYLLWCISMYRSIFRRGTAVYGTAVMIVGLIGSAAPLFPSSILLGICQFICVPACALWFVLVGLQVFRYSKRLSPRASTPVNRTSQSPHQASLP